MAGPDSGPIDVERLEAALLARNEKLRRAPIRRPLFASRFFVVLRTHRRFLSPR